MSLTLAFGSPVQVQEVCCISGQGSDALDGQSLGSSKRTLAAAYAALPSTGGTILAYPGRYPDIVLSRTKPVQIIGMVKPTKQIGSTATTPLSGNAGNAAVIYNSGNAVNLIDTTGAPTGATLTGCRFQDLVFELTGTAKRAVHAIEHCFGEFYNNTIFADKTTTPAPVDAAACWIHNDSTSAFGGDDGSWWRIRDNYVVNAAMVVLGNPPAVGSTNSNNQHIVDGNVCEGLSRLTPGCLPAVSVYGGHRISVRDNNFEGYAVGEMWDHSYGCSSSGNGGEIVDVFIDLYSTHGCQFAPLGIQYSQPGGPPVPHIPGALLVRGDAFTKRNVFVLPATADANDTNGVYPPVASSVQLASPDNVVVSPRYSTDLLGSHLVSPAAVIS